MIIRGWMALSLVALALASPGLADDKDCPGFVDGSEFVELVGDDAVTVEVTIHGSLLRAVSRADPELERLIGGVCSISAVILDVKEAPLADRVVERMRSLERKLMGRDWERLARVREEGSEVKVLVRNDEEMIRGLVVLVLDRDEHQMVFANVGGLVDLAAIAAIGQSMDIPGLGDLDLGGVDDDEDKDDDD